MALQCIGIAPLLVSAGAALSFNSRAEYRKVSRKALESFRLERVPFFAIYRTVGLGYISRPIVISPLPHSN